MSFILTGEEAVGSPYVGGKARALARAARGGLPVPPWLVVSSAAFTASLTATDRAAIEAAMGRGALLQVVEHVALRQEIRLALERALERLCPRGELVAVRSSASDEDGPTHSFAGQLESYLHVRPADVAGRIAAVWRSGFSDRILAYRREHGLPPAPHAPAVLIQRMVNARAAGVAFSADPVTGRRGVAVVSAVHGFGSALVSGEADADTWLVGRDGRIVERRIVEKTRMHVADTTTVDGVRSAAVPARLVAEPAVSDEEARAAAALARAAARHFGRPQDVEWAIEDGRLYLLQSRAITSLDGMADPDAPLAIWDNSNIVESYSGVTTPLTFSFAREIYQHVYGQFCRMMGVPEPVVRAHEDVFGNMLGLVRGRLYYNLLNWYRVLALLPGYSTNRAFMEQMMGVKEPLPEACAREIAAGAARGRTRDAAYLVRTVAGLIISHFTLERRVRSFDARLQAALAPPEPPLEERRPDELVDHYRDLRRRLLLGWDAPLVNDFFAMIFYGLLRRLVVRWCGDAGGTLQNDLIGGEGRLVSAEPAARMRRLAMLAARDPAFVERLAAGRADEILRGNEHPGFVAGCRAYLEKFGDRTVNELKLESSTLHDDPAPLLRTIAALARRLTGGASDPAAPQQLPGDRLRAAARSRVAASMRGRPLRRLAFGWVLHHARARVRDRESLRLERTRLFGRVRRIFVELGRRLHAVGRLDDPRDVFYLEVDEVLAFVEGRATSADLRGLTAVRRREFAAYEEGPPPDERFETRGAVYYGHDFRRSRGESREMGEERRGLGCSPGVARGRVQIVRDPRGIELQPGAILVAEHTDPGWITIFPCAAAVLVERGSLLSHAAIVARELGIPAIVSVPEVTRWLRDGDWVELDGSTGVIRRVAAPAETAAAHAQ